MRKRKKRKLILFPLAQIMAEQRISDSELSRRSGVPRPNVNAIRRGRIDPRWSTLARLLKATGIRVLVMEEGEEDAVAPLDGDLSTRLKRFAGECFGDEDNPPAEGKTVRAKANDLRKGGRP